jgi:hypothetical protein
MPTDFASTTQYCDPTYVKDRVIISTSNTNYDTYLTNAIVEASRLVDMFLTPYITVPLTGTIPDPIIFITADFAASIFKRRYIPNEAKIRGANTPDFLGDVDATGWFALGMKKMLDYIRVTYGIGAQGINPAQTNAVTVNPDIYMGLYAKGILTLQEARQYMANATSTVREALDKVFTTTKLDMESLTKLTTHRIYITKKQNSFGFIKGKSNVWDTNGGYEGQDNQ